MEAKFKAHNKGKIAASSARTYWANIRRLYKLGGNEGEIPKGAAWLKKASLIKKVRSERLNTQKLLSAAAVKMGQVYGVELANWSKLMEKASNNYDKERNKGKATTRERTLMPKGGFEAVRKAAAKLRNQLPAKTENLRDLMQVQDAWLLSFYAKHTPRLIYDVELSKKAENRLVPAGKGFRLILGKHKTSKSMGATTIKLDKSLVPLTGRLIEDSKLTKHNRLLSAPRGGVMTQSALSRRLSKITSKALGRGFGTQILRVLRANSQSVDMKKVREYLNEMGHSLAQEKKYVAK
jgi:integrase